MIAPVVHPPMGQPVTFSVFPMRQQACTALPLGISRSHVVHYCGLETGSFPIKLAGEASLLGVY